MAAVNKSRKASLLSSHLLEFNKNKLVLLCLLVVSLCIRTFWLITTRDYQGDAERRIINLITIIYHPIWPPGYFYIAKPFYILFGHPELILRIISLLSGAASIAMVYMILLKIFSRWEIALFPSILLALFPIHVSYSVQSLSEIPFFFFILLSFYELLNKKILTSSVLLLISCLIRYESWPLAFLIPVYFILPEYLPCLVNFIFFGKKRRAINYGLVYLIISGCPLVLYMAMNNISAGYYLWDLSNQNMHSFWSTISLEKTHSLYLFLINVAEIIKAGFFNVPNPVNYAGIPLGYYVMINRANLDVFGLICLVLLIPLFMYGFINALRLGKYHFILILILAGLTSGVVLWGWASGSRMPYNRYSIYILIFTVIIAGIGLGYLYRSKIGKAISIIATILFSILFIQLDFYSRYNGPDDLYKTASVIKAIIGPSTIEQRFYRSIGATGPQQQTEMIENILHLPAGFFFRQASPQVAYISRGIDPLDPYRVSSICSLADISYDNFIEYSVNDADSIQLPLTMKSVVLALDDYKTGNPATLTKIQVTLLADGYSEYLATKSLVIWVKK